MNRISSNSYFDQTISNIQSSYEKLVKLQTQVQTQEAMERPSDDPVRANQAILLESNLKEIQQYQRNVQSGSDALTYADQTLDSLMVPLNNAISKVQQGLNAEQDSTSRAAIASELEAILDTFISIGNTQLGDKNIFGGSNTTGDVFTRLGGDILFNGNNDDFNLNIAHSETIKANVTANDIFGSSSTILDSEHNLNAKITELSLETGLPIEKTLNVSDFKISGRNVVVNAFVKATGLAITDTKITDGTNGLTALMDGLATTTYDTAAAYTNAVRIAASTAIKGATSTGSDLNLDESFQVQQVIDTAKSNYLSNTSSLTLQSGDHIDTGLLTVTFTSATTTNVASSVAAINKAATEAAGFNAATGEIDHSNVQIDARMAALAAFKAAGTKLGVVPQVDLSTALTTVNTLVTATTTSDTYALAVQNAAVTAFNPTFTTYAGLDANAKTQVDAAVQAAKNTWSATEFSASTTRSGMSIRHSATEQISVAEGSSDARLINSFGITGKNNTSTHIFDTVLTGTTLGADRLMTITLPSADYLNVQLRAGDTVDVIAGRINNAVNQTGIHDDIRQVVASVDNTALNGGTAGVKHLTLTGSSHFRISMDLTTEIGGGNTVSYNAMDAQYRSVEDLRGGNGIDSGTQKIMADNLTTGFGNSVTVMKGDSYEYLVNQLNGLSGFDAALNVDSSGIKLTNMAKYAAQVVPAAALGANSLAISSTTKGTSTTVTFATSTLSEMAEEINAQSSSNHLFNAEVNTAGTGLVITSNETFTLSSTDTGLTKNTSEVSDLSALSLIDSSFLSSLGLNRTPDTAGVIEGRSIVGRQVRLSELNDGQGIRTGTIRITLGNTTADIDMSLASSLRDVKVLIEEAMPNLVKVGINDAGNGIAIDSLFGGSMRIEELNGGAAGRTLGLIKAPASSVTGTSIQGTDIDPAFHGKTLIKDLNGGLGIDTSGFVITNGEHTTTITMDSNGDGVDDIRTLEELVNHINQKSKQDEVYVIAEVDPTKGGLKITSKLSNTSMTVSEKLASNTSYRTTGIVAPATATSAGIMTVFNADRTKSVNVTIANTNTATQIATAINSAAGLAGTGFSFRAVENKSGSVDILSNEAISVSDTVSTAYTTTAYTPNPPVLGTTASDLGLLGGFSDSTLLSTLNSGSGIENGTFKIKYGPATTATDNYSVAVANNTVNGLTFYNETGTSNVIVVDPKTITATETTALLNLGISHAVDTATSTIKFSSTKKFSTVDNVTTSNLSIATTTSHSLFSFSSSVPSGSATPLKFYNENGSLSVDVLNPSTITAAEAIELSNLGITYATDTIALTTTFTSKDRYSTLQGAAAPYTTLPLTVATNTFATTAKEVTVDIEFAETLGEVKIAIEAATNNEILVSFGASNRIELRLASDDDTQKIQVSETGGSLATATTLGLIHPSVVYGRDLRDGTIEQLTNATLLSDLDISLGTIATYSGENDLLISTDVGTLTINVSNARTIGDVISLINSSTATDAGVAIQLQAKVENGKHLSITNSNSGSIDVISSSFSTVAEKLGLVADPELVGESHYQGADLTPQHQAENFFSALTTLRDQFQGGVISNSLVSNTLTRLTQLQNTFLIARGDAGGRISRLDTVSTRYQEESVFIEGLYGDKIGIDIIDTTQRYLAQQQVYESSLSVAGRIIGTSLFNYI